MEAGAAQRERPLKVALVHDFLLDLRGAERVFLAMCDVWPDADIYTAVYDEDGTEGRFSHRRVHTSFLQRLHVSSHSFRPLLPLYPAAIESFELSGYDVVVSSSSAWAHAVICDDPTVHVWYCHNPFRYAWNDRDRTLAARDPLTRSLLSLIFRRWRQWDCRAAERVDRYLTNSRTTQARIRAYFGREAAIVHPPVETGRFRPGPVGEHYLVLSELMPHKRIDTAIRAFNRLGRPLIVAGDGPDSRRLRRLAGPNVSFAGRVSDSEVERLLSSCRALVLTAIEEFGIAAVEAQAAGRPVIALRGGGALETIREGITGFLWAGGPDELAAAVEAFDDTAVDPRLCVENAARFDADRFKEALPQEVERTMETARSKPPRPYRPVLMMTRFARAALPARETGPGREEGQRPAEVG
jgi:glycosyltransferase involved in cell wall biosynthesis